MTGSDLPRLNMKSGKINMRRKRKNVSSRSGSRRFRIRHKKLIEKHLIHSIILTLLIAREVLLQQRINYNVKALYICHI